MSTKPPLPNQEEARLKALSEYHILDTAPEKSFDTIAELAAFICEAPIALISLVDRDRQWFKAKVGLETTETHRDYSFCAHTIVQGSLMVVEDATQDVRFASNPLVTADPHIRFYAGAPLITPSGQSLGSLCIIDRKPQKLSKKRACALKNLADLVVTQLELRRVSDQLAKAAAMVKTLSGLLPICAYCNGIRNDEGYWERLEAYIHTHTQATFSHGICPTCAKKHFPQDHDETDNS
jgi:GAF domain-containing protein